MTPPLWNVPPRYDLDSLLETSRLLVGSLDADFILDNLLRIAMAKVLTSRGNPAPPIRKPVPRGPCPRDSGLESGSRT